MQQYIVMSPCYEILRYGHDKIDKAVKDAHTAGKLAKFVIGVHDLKDPESQPLKNYPYKEEDSPFKFEICQFQAPDIVIFVDRHRNSHILKGQGL